MSSAFLFIDVLRFGEVFDVLFEGLVVAAGFFDEFSVFGAALLEVLDLLVELQEGA